MAPVKTTFVASKPCGCLVAAVVIDPRELADDQGSVLGLYGLSVQDWAERGLTVELTTAGDARARLRRCTCEADTAKAVKLIEKTRDRMRREDYAVKLRDAGKTFDEIGREIHVSKSTARYFYQRGDKRRIARAVDTSRTTRKLVL